MIQRRSPIRYAVVGQGYISQAAVLPAFAHARRNSQLVALVSDDPVKQRRLARKYKVSKVCSYDQYDECLQDVDAVYIALPNDMHHDYTVRAAKAGVHVLCEKPMALTEAECESMILAAQENEVKLMIAYRLHFEEANLTAVEIANEGRIGEPRLFTSTFSMQVELGNIRLQKARGGGPLYDIGIYCINAARYLFQAEPTEVVAVAENSGQARFREVPEAVSAILRFPDARSAAFTCSFGASDVSEYRLVGTKGNLLVEPAYDFTGTLRHCLTIGERVRERSFRQRDQFAPLLLSFSDCILSGREPEPSGFEGLADVRVIRALQRSLETGGAVALAPFEKTRRPTLRQEIRKPAVREREMVRAKSPHPQNGGKEQ